MNVKSDIYFVSETGGSFFEALAPLVHAFSKRLYRHVRDKVLICTRGIYTVSVTVPYVPSPYEVIRKALEIAGLKSGELFLDPGCGDGRSLVIASKEFGAKAVGIEIRRDLLEQAMKNVIEAGVAGNVVLVNGSFFEVKFPKADVVFLYLLTSVNEKLKPKLLSELKPSTRIVSHDFEITGWRPVEVYNLEEGGRSHRIYYYVVEESSRQP